MRYCAIALPIPEELSEERWRLGTDPFQHLPLDAPVTMIVFAMVVDTSLA